VPRRLALGATLLLIGAGSAVPTASASTLPGFRSPTANIRCFALVGHSGGLLCTLGRSAYAELLQARCIDGGRGVDWHGFVLGTAGAGAVNCSGGIQYDPATDHPVTPSLVYGSRWRHGTFTCLSRVAGVTCRNRAGHGLFLSRDTWRAW
jgi:hypothetical protein